MIKKPKLRCMSGGVIRRANPRAGFASSDGCRMFHDDGEYLRHCAKFPDCNVYVHLPHALDATMQRLDSFSSTTSFDNAQAMLCHLAAGCLTLRGCNVDRAFGTVGAGSAGQSLFSYTVANLFGKDSHRFLDMNVHYTERGMTKAGGAFGWKARCDRKCQEEPRLCGGTRAKSASPQTRCQFDYDLQFSQNKCSCGWWKRFAMNDTPKFRGTTRTGGKVLVSARTTSETSKRRQ